MTQNPEIGRQIATGDIVTNYHDLGSGGAVAAAARPGPGVSAFANWRLVMGPLAEHTRVLAPDLAGFATEIPAGLAFSREVWLRQIVDFLTSASTAPGRRHSFGGRWRSPWRSTTPSASTS